MKTRFLLYWACIIFFCNCQPNVKDKIITKIEKNCKAFNKVDDCIFSLESITEFEWDKMYVLDGPRSPDLISKVIGFECDCGFLPDDSRRLVFVKGEKIVYEDEYSVDTHKGIQFRPLDWEREKLAIYTPSTAKFYVLKRADELNPARKGYFFDLYPIEGTLKPKY